MKFTCEHMLKINNDKYATTGCLFFIHHTYTITNLFHNIPTHKIHAPPSGLGLWDEMFGYGVFFTDTDNTLIADDGTHVATHQTRKCSMWLHGRRTEVIPCGHSWNCLRSHHLQTSWGCDVACCNTRESQKLNTTQWSVARQRTGEQQVNSTLTNADTTMRRQCCAKLTSDSH